MCENGVCERAVCESGGHSVRSVVIPQYLTGKQQVSPSGGLPPSAKMGRRRTSLWGLSPCCNPKKKAKKRNKLASSQVLEAEVRAAGGRGLSPGPLGHLSVCRLRISLSTLLFGVCLGKFLRLPWVLRRQAWIPGSPLPRACQVEVEAAGQSEL